MNKEKPIKIGIPLELTNEDGTIDNVVLLRPNEIKALEYKLQELERYKNIVDELEKHICKEWYCFDNESVEFEVSKDILNKLKELKGE